jgi:hypothetical protein
MCRRSCDAHFHAATQPRSQRATPRFQGDDRRLQLRAASALGCKLCGRVLLALVRHHPAGGPAAPPERERFPFCHARATASGSQYSWPTQSFKRSASANLSARWDAALLVTEAESDKRHSCRVARVFLCNTEQVCVFWRSRSVSERDDTLSSNVFRLSTCILISPGRHVSCRLKGNPLAEGDIVYTDAKFGQS